jgi:hypothetical protein
MQMSEKVEELLYKELDKIGSKELTAQSLENVCKISKSLYYLVAARTMEEGGYSEDYMYDDGRYSGRRYQKRDSMGRYTRDNGSSYDNSYDGYNSRNRNGGRYYNDRDGGYSGHNEMEDMLRNMMDKSTDPKERETIQKMMSQMGR